MSIIQITIKIIFTLGITYIFIVGLVIIWTKEINLGKWTKTKIENYIPVTSSPIDISPSKISLKTGIWRGTSSFNIYNNSSEILYDIYIKIKIEDSEISSQNIKIIPKNETDFIEGKLSDNSINFDNMQISGTDSKGNECVLMVVYSLLPHESRQFKINTAEVSSLKLEQINVFIDLVKYSKEPVQVLAQGRDKVAFPFKLNEAFTIKAVSFYVKKSTTK